MLKNIYHWWLWDWHIWKNRRDLRGMGKRTGVFYELLKLLD